MKPITDFEKTVVELNKHDWPLSPHASLMATESVLPIVAVRAKNMVTTCLHCGNAMVYTGQCKDVICLGCGNTVRVVEREAWRVSGHSVSGRFSTIRIIEDNIELEQTYELTAVYDPDTNRPKYSYKEICRHWRNQSGEEVVTALPYIFGQFVYFGKIKLRRKPLMVYRYLAQNSKVLKRET